MKFKIITLKITMYTDYLINLLQNSTFRIFFCQLYYIFSIVKYLKKNSIYGIITMQMDKGVKHMETKEANPGLSAYECLLLIFSGLVERGIVLIKQKSLVERLYELKKESKLKNFLSNIIFKESIDNVSSKDIDDGLVQLQTYGSIGRINPTYEKIVIYISLKDANALIKTYKTYKEDIDYICDKFQF